jgi:excinuclease ABC subunit A
MSRDVIEVRGAEEHNLKDVDVEIPREELTVVTGLSGSGKSSLAFETVYAEGQRRYIESLSAYARNFLGQMDKPQVENVEGLSPAISIDQKNAANNPRSTVGTVTELHDYLRLLYARVGVPHCPECGREVGEQSASNMVDRVLELPEGTRAKIAAPVVRDQKGAFEDLFDELVADGYARVEVDGEEFDLTLETPDLDENYDHTVDVVVDRIRVSAENRSRITDSVETAVEEGDGLVKVVLPDPPGGAAEDLGGATSRSVGDLGTGEESGSAATDDGADGDAETDGEASADPEDDRLVVVFSEDLACTHCGIDISETASARRRRSARTWSSRTPRNRSSTSSSPGATTAPTTPASWTTSPSTSASRWTPPSKIWTSRSAGSSSGGPTAASTSSGRPRTAPGRRPSASRA